MHLHNRFRTGNAVVLALLAVVTSACSSGSTASTGPSGAAPASPGGKLSSILFVNPLPDYPAWKTIGDCMEKEAQANNVEFTETGPTGGNVNAPYMLDRIQQGVANKVGAIVTFPLSADTFDPAFKRARDAGVKIATVEGSGDTQSQDLNAGTSFAEFGALAAKTVAAKGGQQNVGFLIDIKTGVAKTYVDAFTEAAKDYPNIKIVDTRYDNGDSTKDIDLATAMITANPELNHIVTNLGAATPGIIAAIKQKNAVGRVFLTTNSIYSGSVEGMKEGIVYSFLLQDMCAIGTTPVKALVDLAAGKEVPKDIPTRIEFATAATVDQLTADGTLQ